MGSLFELAIPIVLRHEGGYINDPADPGGETNFGISKRSYPNLDIKALTRDEASAIYKRDWWDAYRVGDIIPQAVANKLLDTAVNCGAKTAIKFLQEACGVTADGVLGPETLQAVNTMNSLTVIHAMQSLQAQHYQNLINDNPSLEKFKNNWMNRAYDRC